MQPGIITNLSQLNIQIGLDGKATLRVWWNQTSRSGRFSMKEILQDLFHAGIGLTRLKKEDLDKVFNELKNRGEVEEEDREFFISSAVEKLERKGKEISEKIMSTVNPNIERLKELNAKVDELIREIDALKKKKT